MATLNEALNKRLKTLQKGKNSLSIEQADAVMHALAETVGEYVHAEDSLYQALQELAGRMAASKQELIQIGSSDMNEATAELGSIVASTEEAANAILEAAEQIMEAAGKLPEGAARSQVEAATTKIFEACHFQDLTGQRVTKTLSILQDIETTITRLLGKAPAAGAAKPKAKPSIQDEKSLLNGPGLKGETPSQDDIDQWFKDA